MAVDVEEPGGLLLVEGQRHRLREGGSKCASLLLAAEG
jgi:hypothetical protein